MLNAVCHHVSLALICLGAVGLSSCRVGEPSVVDLRLARHGWDSLTVHASFGTTTWWGGTRTVEPDVSVLYLFDSQYDTLFAGPIGGVPVRDQTLDSEEGLLVEVCGDVGSQRVCDQAGVGASPKRITATTDVDYPDEGNPARGRYALDFTVERRRFDGSGWERIDPGAMAAHARAYVEGHEEHAVQFPLRAGEGRFELSGQPGYDDFAFELNSKLYDERRADVRFDLYAALNGSPRRISSMERSVREKMPSERRHEVAELARAAARHMLDRLADESRPQASMYVDEWRFNTITDRYTIAVELVWEEERGYFRRRRCRLRGELTVAVAGTDAQFTVQDGDREGQRRWGSRVDGDVLVLPNLDVSETLARTGQPDDSVRPIR